LIVAADTPEASASSPIRIISSFFVSDGVMP
jgi:hypothetical protein